MNLEERQENYENSYDYSIIARIPVLIKLNIRSFNKITRNTKKPYCHKTMKALTYAAQESIKEIDGAVLGYIFNDEIIFVLKNDNNVDTDPWFNNKIQSIGSVTSSLVTHHFQWYTFNHDSPPNITGHVIFKSHVFGLPSITEVINYLILKQHSCNLQAVNLTVAYELSKIYSKNDALDIISEKNTKERLEILKNECNIDINNYPSSFLRGVGIYKAPHIIDGKTKYKWTINYNIPNFIENKSFLLNIIMNGSDIFRPE